MRHQVDAIQGRRELVALVTGNQSGIRCDACRSCGASHCVDAWDSCSGMRDYTTEEVAAALDARILAGIRAALEAAAQSAIDVLGVLPTCSLGTAQDKVSAAIRNIDPTQIVLASKNK